MRKIEIGKWKEPDGKGKDIDVSLLSVLNGLIGGRKPEQLGRGVDGFRTMGRVAKAFEKAEKSGTLELEEVDYKALKEIVEKDVPDTWGFSKDISAAIERFLTAEIEK
jgi:hypothetical protein